MTITNKHDIRKLSPYIFYDCIDAYWPLKPTIRMVVDKREKVVRINRACPPNGRIVIVDRDGCHEMQ